MSFQENEKVELLLLLIDDNDISVVVELEFL